MSVRWSADVTLSVSPDGGLEVFSWQTGICYRCPPYFTVMWLCLLRHDGDVESAAAELSETWETTPEKVLAVLGLWLKELRESGLLLDD